MSFNWFYCYLSTDEDDAIVPSLAHYDVSTEQATEEMLFDFENKSSKISPYKSNLHIYIISITICSSTIL